MNTKTLKLSNCEVVLKTDFLWIHSQEIEAILTGGAKFNNAVMSGFDGNALLAARMKTMEMLVVEIVTGEEKQAFSRSWLETLSVEDGDILMDTLDEITKSKKK